MGIFSRFIKKEKLTKAQIEKIEEKVQETKKRYSKKEKSSSELPKAIQRKVKTGKLKDKHKKILKQRGEVYDLIQKPFDIEDLLKRVKKIVG